MATVETTVTVECWQNQRYKPLDGWARPYDVANGIPAYSSAAGFALDNAKPSSSSDNSVDTFPDIPLPEGWCWVAGSKWSIDTSTTYGEVSYEEGWAYATGFNTLFSQTVNRKLSSKKNTSSLVRRRRWTRQKKCDSLEATRVYESSVRGIKHLRRTIEHIQSHMTHDIDGLIAYDEMRIVNTTEMLQTIEAIFQSIISSLSDMKVKLGNMKEFLTDKAAIELEYAHCLRGLSRKWTRFATDRPVKRKEGLGGDKHASTNSLDSMGTTSTTSIERSTSSISFSDNAAQPNPDEDTAPPGFFELMATAHHTTATSMFTFSHLLADSLPKDVDQVLSGVVDQLEECTSSSLSMRQDILHRLSRIHHCRLLIQYHAQQLSDLYSLESYFHQSSLTLHTAAFEEESRPTSSRQRRHTVTSGSATSPQKPAALSSMLGALSPTKYSDSGDVSLTSENNDEDVIDMILPKRQFAERPQGDLWFLMRHYHQLVTTTQAQLHCYQALSSQCCKQKDKLILTVRSLLVATTKVLTTQQVRVWEDYHERLGEVVRPGGEQLEEQQGGPGSVLVSEDYDGDGEDKDAVDTDGEARVRTRSSISGFVLENSKPLPNSQTVVKQGYLVYRTLVSTPAATTGISPSRRLSTSVLSKLEGKTVSMAVGIAPSEGEAATSVAPRTPTKHTQASTYTPWKECFAVITVEDNMYLFEVPRQRSMGNAYVPTSEPLLCVPLEGAVVHLSHPFGFEIHPVAPADWHKNTEYASCLVLAKGCVGPSDGLQTNSTMVMGDHPTKHNTSKELSYQQLENILGNDGGAVPGVPKTSMVNKQTATGNAFTARGCPMSYDPVFFRPLMLGPDSTDSTPTSTPIKNLHMINGDGEAASCEPDASTTGSDGYDVGTSGLGHDSASEPEETMSWMCVLSHTLGNLYKEAEMPRHTSSVLEQAEGVCFSEWEEGLGETYM